MFKPIDFKILKAKENKYASESLLIKEIRTEKIFMASNYLHPPQMLAKEENNELQKQLLFKSSLSHPFLAQFIGVCERDNSFPIFISEYISNNTLLQVIDNYKSSSKPSNWTDTKKLINIYGIASAMSYLVDNKILPVFLAPENIFETSELYPKLSNYGFPAFNYLDIKIFNQNYSNLNSPIFDIISFGIIIYLIISGEPPFPEKEMSYLHIIAHIINGDKKIIFNQKIPEVYKELIKSCFSITRPHPAILFKEIMYKLIHDDRFITDSIDKDEFYNFVGLVSNQKDEEEEENYLVEDEIFNFISRKYCHPLILNSNILNIDRFKKEEPIERKRNFILYKIRDKETKQLYTAEMSIDLIYEENKDSTIGKSFKQAIDFHSRISHPSIIKYFGYSPIDFSKSYKPMIITEFMKNNTLDDILELESKNVTIRFWNDTMKLIIIYGVASGMSYLHSHNIKYRNLDAKNIFLDDHLFPKISNFNFGEYIDEYKYISFIGTDFYFAPEVDEIHEYNDEPANVYVFGILLFYILTASLPHATTLDLHESNRLPEIPDNVSIAFKKLILRCWNHNPRERPTFDDIVNELKTNFITENIDKNLYCTYIDLIEKQQKGLKITENDLGIFKKYDTQPIYQYYMKEEIQNELKSININPLFLNEYEKEGTKIGSGGFGKVYVIKNKYTGLTYAAKELNKTPTTNEMFRKNICILHEVNILSQLSHPCIMKLIGYSPFNFKNEEKPVIVSEYISNGSLESILSFERDKKRLDFWNDTMRLINIYGIALAISYLHSHNIGMLIFILASQRLKGQLFLLKNCNYKKQLFKKTNFL